jgi:hypothetical protein
MCPPIASPAWPTDDTWVGPRCRLCEASRPQADPERFGRRADIQHTTAPAWRHAANQGTPARTRAQIELSLLNKQAPRERRST